MLAKSKLIFQFFFFDCHESLLGYWRLLENQITRKALKRRSTNWPLVHTIAVVFCHVGREPGDDQSKKKKSTNNYFMQ